MQLELGRVAALQIRDLETIFRRANFTEGSDDSIQHMNYSEFIDAVGLIAMYGFGREPYKSQYPSPLEKVTALFEYMGFKVRPPPTVYIQLFTVTAKGCSRPCGCWC